MGYNETDRKGRTEMGHGTAPAADAGDLAIWLERLGQLLSCNGPNTRTWVLRTRQDTGMDLRHAYTVRPHPRLFVHD